MHPLASTLCPVRGLLTVGLLATLPFVAPSLVVAQPITEVEVTPTGEVAFRQERALAYMAELEDRMFRLAELVREAQPADASRLTLAVQTSREALLTDRMRQITTLLNGAELYNAEATQQEVLRQLEELKRLLLTADLDLELKLRELEALDQALQKLGALEQKERTQREQTGRLNEVDAAQRARLAELLEGDERRNERSAEDLEQSLEKLGTPGSVAAGSVGRAGGAMGEAAAALEGGAGDEAAGKQDEALQRLAEAREQLQQRREQLEEEVQNLARRRVMENLEAMLAQQQDIGVVLAGLLAGVKDASAEAVAALPAAVQRLAKPQDELVTLAGQTIDLAQKAEFSIALPAALGLTRDRMIVLSDDLRTGRGDAGTLAESKAIKAELEELLGAMRLADRQPGNRQPGEQGDRARDQEKKFNQIAAELRMLKLMQQGVNRQTVSLDEAREAGRVKPENLKVRTDILRQLQDAVRAATVKLDAMMKEPAGG